MSIQNLINLKIDPDGRLDAKSKPIAITIGQVQKFNYNGKFERVAGFEKTVKSIDPVSKKEVYDISKLPKAAFSTAGSCDNFPLEVHLQIGFEPIPIASATTPVGNKITSATVSIIYGKIVASPATAAVSISRKNSVQYLEGKFSRLNSGAPGYIKGMQLKVGSLNTDGLSTIEKGKMIADNK